MNSSPPAPASTFDIFGGNKPAQTTTSTPINLNINMFANNINFNFGEKAKL